MIEKPRLITNYIYFYHLDKFCILPLYPESITDSKGSNFQQTNALSRSSPVFTYSNSGARNVSITLELHRDLMNDLNTGVSNLKGDDVVVPFRNTYDEEGNLEENDYIDLLINYLQAASVPKYQIYNHGSKAVIPPMVAVRFGDDVFIKGVITNEIQVTYARPIMITQGGKSKYAKITVGFNINETDPYDADSIASMGSFRGICSTNDIYATNTNSQNNAQSYDRTSPGGGSRSTIGPRADWLVRHSDDYTAGSGDNDRNKINKKKDPFIDFTIKGGVRR